MVCSEYIKKSDQELFNPIITDLLDIHCLIKKYNLIIINTFKRAEMWYKRPLTLKIQW